MNTKSIVRQTKTSNQILHKDMVNSIFFLISRYGKFNLMQFHFTVKHRIITLKFSGVDE